MRFLLCLNANPSSAQLQRTFAVVKAWFMSAINLPHPGAWMDDHAVEANK